MAMLGLLQRIQLGLAPQPVAEMFPPARRTMYSYLPGSTPFHNKQLHCSIEPGSSGMMKRSLFGLVRVYNRLPAEVVDACSVKSFQTSLQNRLKNAANSGEASWERMFHAS